MAKVEVVNRQVIDGKEYKRGSVVDVSDGRARDLINAGKARPVTTEAAPKPPVLPANKEVKNG